MDYSLLVLIITGVLGLLGFGFIIAAALISENNIKNNSANGGTGFTGTTGITGLVCSGPGTVPLLPAPPFVRVSPKSISSGPLSSQPPNYPTIQHTVQKSYRGRALQDVISPNHWVANSLHGETNFFCVYPYFASIQDDGLSFSWPTTPHIQGTAGTDLSYEVTGGPSIKMSSAGENIMSCDVLDIDAMAATVAWQFNNMATGRTGSIICPLVKGSPYLTFELNNVSMSFQTSLASSLTATSDPTIYTLTNYVIYLPVPITLLPQGDFIIIPRITGVVRIAYYQDADALTLLSQYRAVYPIESTISTVSTTGPNNTWNVDTTVAWTTSNIGTPSSSEVLMLALPHHDINNIIYHSIDYPHNVIGPYQYVTTTDNEWQLIDNVQNVGFTYPPITGTGATALQTVWNTEVQNIMNVIPSEPINWFKWVGSLANMILIGESLGAVTTVPLSLLRDELNNPKKIVYDTTWGGVMSDLGILNCLGDSDGGNAFYENHLGEFGYLVLAYAVVSRFDSAFLNRNNEIIMWYIRNIANPYQNDTSFPLWRNKDWYYGYSLSSGLSPHQVMGKNTSNIAESVSGYFACYLVSILTNNTNLMEWSLAMLASEITALQTYFQVASSNVTVDPAFIQGTITSRGDSYYQYVVSSGNTGFPQRDASMMVPMLKPLTLMSQDYVNTDWALHTQPFMTLAVTGDIQPESLGYAEVLLAVNSGDVSSAVELIVANSNTVLPYGSTWSSMLYWILAQ